MIKIIGSTIQHMRGDTGVITLSLTDSSDNPYTLAEGDKAVFSVKKSYDTAEYILQKEAVENEIALTHEDTKDLPYGKYLYDIEVTLADDKVITVATGIYNLLPDVTV